MKVPIKKEFLIFKKRAGSGIEIRRSGKTKQCFFVLSS